MPQEWDEQGNPIQSAPSVTEWDESGNPITDTKPPAKPSRAAQFMDAAGSYLNPLIYQEGAAKGLGSTLFNTTDLINRGIRMIPGADKYVPPMPPKPDWLSPQNTPEKIGYGTEQVGEFLAPAGEVAKGAKALDVAANSPKALKVASGAGKAILEALSAGGVGTAQTGNPEEGAKIGAMTGGLSGMAQALAPIANKIISPISSRLSPIVEDALNYLRSKGVPLTAGQTSGSEPLQKLEKSLVNVPGAAGQAQKFFSGQDQALANVGENLVNGNSPGQAQTATEAGESLASRLQGRIQDLKDYADKRYDQVKSILTSPRNEQTMKVGEALSPIVDEFGGPITTDVKKTFQSPVDVSTVKDSLASIVRDLDAAMPEAQRQASPGYAAVKQILSGPDTIDALTADKNLGALKSLLRQEGSGGKYLSTKSQGLARTAISSLTEAVEDTLKDAGGSVAPKLFQARKAVQSYYDTAELLNSLPKNAVGDYEPAAVFQRLTGGTGDRNGELLKNLQQYAPKEMKEIGRTWLQGLLDQITTEGGFQRAQGAFGKFQKMGPETRKVLLGSQADDVEKFLLGAKRLTTDINPSGTAKTGLATLGPLAVVYDMATGSGDTMDRLKKLPRDLAMLAAAGYTSNTLARLLFEPNAAKILTQGLRINATSGAMIGTRALGTGSLSRLFSPSQPPQNPLAP